MDCHDHGKNVIRFTYKLVLAAVSPFHPLGFLDPGKHTSLHISCTIAHTFFVVHLGSHKDNLNRESFLNYFFECSCKKICTKRISVRVFSEIVGQTQKNSLRKMHGSDHLCGTRDGAHKNVLCIDMCKCICVA